MQAASGGEQAFFQIAAGLIPLLTFGGILATRPRKLGEYEKRAPWEMWLAQHLAEFGLIAIFGELFAIIGAITGYGGAVLRPVVIAVVLGSMFLLVLTASLRHRQAVGLPVQASKRASIAMTAAVTVMIGFTAFGFDDLVRLAQKSAELGSRSSNRTLQDVQDELRQVAEREEARTARRTNIQLRLVPLLAIRHPNTVERRKIGLLQSAEDLIEGTELSDLKLSVRLTKEEVAFYGR